MGDRLPVDCGVKLDSGKYFVLLYRVGKNVKKRDIIWQWEQASGEGSMYAKMEARADRGDIKYHNSAPISTDMIEKLGKPDVSKDGEFLKVKLKKLSKEDMDLSKYFDVPQ